MTTSRSSYLSPGLVESPCSRGKGLGTFAARSCKKGDVLAVFGGDVLTYSELEECAPERKRNCVQITEALYLVPRAVGPGDHINHSCAPNAGIRGQILLVALRDIEGGEEICYDYAMTDTSDYDQFSCLCGTSECRGSITGNDWKLPNLRTKYHGYFSSYVESLQAQL